ncbi:predicted protein [Naegleria gruberi]|uniref:Predicted protein n=1 Tax=Naegleria gruberi TaxID=5762 RepID=D2VTW0_NAEGR|nr:uncharacterized protein NAEGRDRAFT_72446 [Naegleria gruberi]EFC39724.1 predicted protein [Naegleria gruberi]|eukprot:XP_002672468.1 predicted protein [Naegleria gruberi strain NEG-M]
MRTQILCIFIINAILLAITTQTTVHSQNPPENPSCTSQFLVNNEISKAMEYLQFNMFMMMTSEFDDHQQDFSSSQARNVKNCSLANPCENLTQILSVLNKTLVEDNFNFYNRSTERLVVLNINLLNDILDTTEHFIETPIISGLNYIFKFKSVSDSDRNLIQLKWKGSYDRSYVLTRPDIKWFYFENVTLNLFRLNNTDVANLGFCNCLIVDTWLNFVTNRDFYIEKSQLIRSIIYATTNLWFYDRSETIKYGEYYVTGLTAIYNNSEIHETRLRWTVSSVTNLIIENSLFEDFLVEMTFKQVTNVLIRNSTFIRDYLDYKEESVNALQGNSFRVINCTFQHAYSFLFVRSYIFVSIDSSIVSNNQLMKENLISVFYGIIAIQSCITVMVSNSQFSNNEGYERASALYLSDVNVFHVRNCQFTNNSASSIFSNSYPNRMFDNDKSYYWYTVSNCKFEGNTCNKEGCGIYISDSIDLTIQNNIFLNNTAQYGGAALFIKIGARAVILNNLFIGNKVLYNNLLRQPASTFYYGGGGAVSIITTQLGLSESKLLANTFINNEALYGGSLFFVRESLVEISNSTFIGNKAKRGGAMFYYSPSVEQTEIFDNVFKENVAEIGNDLLTSVVALDWDNSTVHHVKPGDAISLDVKTFELGGLLIPTNTENFTVFTDNPSVYLDFLQNETSFTISMYLMGDVTPNSYGNFTLFLDSNPAITFFHYSINSCGEGNELRVIGKNQMAVLKCVPSPASLLPLILSVSIPVGVFIAIVSVFIGIILGMVGIPKINNIKRRLNLLQEKESAEQSVEQKIIDKKVVFNMNDEGDFKEPLLKNYELEDPIFRFIISPKDIDIVKKVAEGGNGVVYKGTWKGIEVAIKTIKAKNESRDDFENEISLLASIRNPHILNFYGVCVTENETFMITEFLENGSLEGIIYLSRIGQFKLSFHEKLRILYEVAIGMDYLHSLTPKIVHRDLKPGNILLDKDMHCKVCDFGLSRTVNQNTNHSITRNVGTLFYLSPEMFEIDQTKVDPHNVSKIDTYSFGIIMWELFFELAPFTENRKTVRMLHEDENSNNLNTINMLHLVSKGKRPSIPFESIEEVREWLLIYEEDKKFKGANIVLEYFELTKQCWSEQPSTRPEFNVIVKKLYNFMERIKQ